MSYAPSGSPGGCDTALPVALLPVVLAVHPQDGMWWAARPSNPPVSRSEPKASVHSSKDQLVLTMMGPPLFDDQQVKSIQLPCRLGGRLPLQGSINSCTKAAEMEKPTVVPLLQTSGPVPTRRGSSRYR